MEDLHLFLEYQLIKGKKKTTAIALRLLDYHKHYIMEQNIDTTKVQSGCESSDSETIN